MKFVDYNVLDDCRDLLSIFKKNLAFLDSKHCIVHVIVHYCSKHDCYCCAPQKQRGEAMRQPQRSFTAMDGPLLHTSGMSLFIALSC